jgi:hypothetical protein
MLCYVMFRPVTRPAKDLQCMAGLAGVIAEGCRSVALCTVAALIVVHAAEQCMPQCSEPLGCIALNGELDKECNECDESTPCHHSAPHFTTWRERRAQLMSHGDVQNAKSGPAAEPKRRHAAPERQQTAYTPSGWQHTAQRIDAQRRVQVDAHRVQVDAHRVQIDVFGSSTDTAGEGGASEELRARRTRKARRPRVYLYDHRRLSEYLEQLGSWEGMCEQLGSWEGMREWAFNHRLGASGAAQDWWTTETFNLGAIIVHRLLTSGYGGGG